MGIYVLSTVTIGIDLIDIIKRRIKIDGVIGLSERSPGDSISGYIYKEKYCKENNINFFPVNSYSLLDKYDREKISKLDIDILIVAGWGRLIPDWLIKKCKLFPIGIHGSAYGMIAGRGRSPENWALILGEKKFSISIFKIDSGIDSGGIFDTRDFDITELDDIASVRYNMISNVGQMLISLLSNDQLTGVIKFENMQIQRQIGVPYYLPKRTPEDGEIDWRRTSKEIYNFIRALAKPYPGAYSVLDNDVKLVIWDAIPIENASHLDGCKYGEILTTPVQGGPFLVRTANSGLMITHYEINLGVEGGVIKKGCILKSVDFYEQCKSIFERHYQQYPNDTVQPKLIDYAEHHRN